MLAKRVAIKEFFVKDFCNRDETTAHVTVGTLSKRELVDRLRQKFVDEARALSRLSHPGIVRVSDVFEENGTAYFVMDYIEGLSLSDIVAHEGQLPEWRAVNYIRQVAEALNYVHTHNRLHLDVKPSNILVDSSDRAVLIDFGASKQYDEVNGENTSTLMGKTPGYAPLEQMANDVGQFRPSVDIYALGATFYKLLTGSTPPASTLLASGTPLPPLPAATSSSVVRAIEAAMNIRKEERPQDIPSFLSILDGEQVVNAVVVEGSHSKAIASGEPTEQTGVSLTATDFDENQIATSGASTTKGSRWWIWAVAVLGCIAIAAISFILFGEGGDDNGPIMVKNMKYVNSRGVAFVYSGECTADSIPHGEGIGKGYDGGGLYKGRYSHGFREGECHYTTTDGEFKGSFANDIMSQGRFTWTDSEANGSYYEGTFDNEENFYTGTFYDSEGHEIAHYSHGALID